MFHRTRRGGHWPSAGQLRFPHAFAERDCGNTSQSRFARQLPSRGAFGFCTVSSLPLRGGGMA